MFGDLAEKYIQRGFSVVPVKGKRALKKGWGEACKKIPSDEVLEKWINECDSWNIGLACGEASGISALDIDTDDPFVLNLFPKSICGRRGSKGEVRFYKFNPKLRSTKVKDSNGKNIVELFSQNGQVVIPPSIHPDTGLPYQYLTEIGLDSDKFDRDDLPELPENLDQLFELVRKRYSSEPKELLKSGGRHDALLAMCFAAIGNGETDDMIKQSLIEYDNTHHKIPWFEDENINLDNFISGARRTVNTPNPSSYNVININPAIEHQKELDQKELEDLTILAEELQEADSDDLIKPEPLPIPEKGLLNLFYKGIMSMDYRDISPIAVASAHSLVGMMFSHKFKLERDPSKNPTLDKTIKLLPIYSWPHGYYLTLAPTGWGKSFGPRFITQTLSSYVPELRNLEICNGFGSHQGVIYQLRDSPITMVKIEEASGLFKLAADGIKKKSNAIAETLCEIFSGAYDRVQLAVTKGIKKEEKGGKVEARYPALTILGFTTLSGFETSVTQELSTTGLIPRFKIFDCYQWEETHGVDHENKLSLSPEELNKLISMVKAIMSKVTVIKGANIALEDRILATDSGKLGMTYEDNDVIPHNVLLEEGTAKQYLEPLQLWSRSLMNKLEKDHPTRGYLNRCVEHVCLIALEYELSMFDWDDKTKVDYFFCQPQEKFQKQRADDIIELTPESIDYGFRMFKYNLYNFHKLSRSMSSGDDWSNVQQKILEEVGKAGPEGLLLGKLGQRVRSKDRHRIIDMLRIEGRLRVFRKGKRTVLVLPKFAAQFMEHNSGYKMA